MRILLEIATLALAACATPQPPLTHIDWRAERARIARGDAILYVVRPWQASGHRNLCRISIDGMPLMGGGMPVRSYFSCQVAAATIRVSAQAVPSVRNIRSGLPFLTQPQLTLSTRPGEIAFIRVGADAEGGLTLTEVDADQGRALAEHSKKLPVCGH